MSNNLVFLNHASFLLEDSETILVIDPWLEGSAFNQGWSLLSKETSNAALIKFLQAKKKRIYIWYSHEHSDHFSISFLKAIEKSKLSVTILFQKTFDQRVVKYLKNKFKVIELDKGKVFKLSSDINIRVWPHYYGGDSYCLIGFSGKYILNINDCAIRSISEAKRLHNNIKKHTNKISYLFTQFGYAEWIGGRKQKKLRENVAKKCINNITIQMKILSPEVIIPFASYAYFCNNENFYMNDSQNSPTTLLNSNWFTKTQKEKLFFMRPWQTLSIDNLIGSFEKNNKINENYWNDFINKIMPLNSSGRIKYDVDELKISFEAFRERINKNIFYIPLLFELILFIKPLKIMVDEKTFRLSYVSGMKDCKDGHHDIKITSSDLKFILDNDFGFNTTFINARFEASTYLSKKKFSHFFIFQDIVKNGSSSNSLINSLKLIFNYFKIYILTNISKRI